MAVVLTTSSSNPPDWPFPTASDAILSPVPLSPVPLPPADCRDKLGQQIPHDPPASRFDEETWPGQFRFSGVPPTRMESATQARETGISRDVLGLLPLETAALVRVFAVRGANGGFLHRAGAFLHGDVPPGTEDGLDHGAGPSRPIAPSCKRDSISKRISLKNAQAYRKPRMV